MNVSEERVTYDTFTALGGVFWQSRYKRATARQAHRRTAGEVRVRDKEREKVGAVLLYRVNFTVSLSSHCSTLTIF